jgi:DNA modification methylase
MTVRIVHGDCRDVLTTLPDQNVQCVVTSPPYFGLRDYGTAEWSGGDMACEHKKDIGARQSSGLNGSLAHKDGRVFTPYSHVCGKCGATRIDSQIGLEASPAAYVAEMVAVFSEVRRVLRDDGTVFLNLGDSYAANGAGSWGSSNKSTLTTGSRNGAWAPGKTIGKTPARVSGAKPKDLLGIPWRVAFALQADGWYLRSAIVWHKPNPMPESVSDRPTSSYEMVFLLAKKERYFYDAEAIREDGVVPAGALGAKGSAERFSTPGVNSRPPEYKVYDGQRNARNVWTIATQPFSGSHFATMPPDLAERCIKAGSKPGDTVLDPFSGAGTTALVADRLNRHAIGIELNQDYAAMGRNRVQDDAPLFAEVS